MILTIIVEISHFHLESRSYILFVPQVMKCYYVFPFISINTTLSVRGSAGPESFSSSLPRLSSLERCRLGSNENYKDLRLYLQYTNVWL